MSWFANFSIPWRAARLPASAGAGQASMEAMFQDGHCGAEALRDEPPQSYSLTYSEIGLGLCQCVESGLITMEQAIEIGNHHFPIRSNEHGMDPHDHVHVF